jgi:hypothetical protein
MAEVSPKPFGAASQSPPRPPRTITDCESLAARQGFPAICKTGFTPQRSTPRHYANYKPNAYAIVGGGLLDGATCIQFEPKILPT